MSINVNLQGVSQATTGITALSNLILATPNTEIDYTPQGGPNLLDQYNPPNPQSQNSATVFNPLVFNYEGENMVTLESDITDYTVEDNTPAQNQIALRPELIQTQGFIGELNDLISVPKLGTSQGLTNISKIIQSKLQAVSAYAPGLSTSAFILMNEAILALEVANSAWSSGASWLGQNSTSLTGSRTQTKQQKYFAQFYFYWKNRTLFTVQTPWAIFKNCAIKSVRAIQDQDTRMVTSFDVQFKVIRYASTITTAVNPANSQGRGNAQAWQGNATNLGTNPTQGSVPFSNALGVYHFGP